MNKKRFQPTQLNLWSLARTIISLTFFGIISYYLWFCYSQLPAFQQHPQISTIKQVNESLVNRVLEGFTDRTNREAIGTAPLRDPLLE